MNKSRPDLFRLVNAGAAAAGIVFLSPLFLLASLAIVVTGGFPIFFRQPRVGLSGKMFHLVKFRSMRASASGAQITGAGDARITAVGRILRKYKIDELPQLWNVLTGDMSLVGPRPEVARFVDPASPVWRTVLCVRPGVTDLASLLYRNEEELLAAAANVEEEYRLKILPHKLALNLEYLRLRNPWTDLKLIALTIWYSAFPSRADASRIRRKLLGRSAD